MLYSDDKTQIRQWAPLLFSGRTGNESMACTFMEKGTDVDYGQLTKFLISGFVQTGGEIRMNHTVQSLWDVGPTVSLGWDESFRVMKFLECLLRHLIPESNSMSLLLTANCTV